MIEEKNVIFKSFNQYFQNSMQKGDNEVKDEKIVRLLLDKDELGLKALKSKYEKLLVYVATGILGQKSRDIEECINDTYLKIWNNIQNFDLEKAEFRTYIKMILRNTAINKLRDTARAEGYLKDEDMNEVASKYVDYRQNTEQLVINKENAKEINNIIAGFKKKDRELVIRRYFYMQSSKDIARHMKMTVSAVDSKLSRLRRRMKTAYEKVYINNVKTSE